MNSALKKKNLFNDRNTKTGPAGILLKLDPKLTETWENLPWISMGFGSAEWKGEVGAHHSWSHLAEFNRSPLGTGETELEFRICRNLHLINKEKAIFARSLRALGLTHTSYKSPPVDFVSRGSTV